MKKVYRLPPCPKHDIEATESWLTDLAAEGLLEKDGYFAGIFTFERTKPQKVRYRLASANQSIPFLFWSDSDAPTHKEQTLSEEFGWEYITRRGGFYIYRTADSAAPELHTDPELTAQTLTALKRRERNWVIYLLFWVVLYPLLYHFDQGLVLLTITFGTLRTLYIAAFIAFLFIRSLVIALHMRRLQRKLRTEGDIDHRKDWQAGKNRYRIFRGCYCLAVILFAVVLFGRLGSLTLGEKRTPLDEIGDSVPFATLSDFVEGDYQPEKYNPYNAHNSIHVWNDPLSPVNYDWNESGIITTADGTQWNALLYVDYHETVSPWLAQTIGREYVRHYQEKDSVVQTLPDLGVDYAAAVSQHGTHIVLREGSTVLHAYLSQYSDHTLTVEDWAAVLAESIKD